MIGSRLVFGLPYAGVIKMSKYRDYVLVLWGDEFEEVAATIFVTGLREAGLRVKVVGLTPPHIAGAHGLALVPDLTLDQALALAEHAICVVIPYASPGFKRLKNDPRIPALLSQAQANQAKVILGPLHEADLAQSGLLLVSPEQVIVYPDNGALMEFVHKLGGSLGLTN